MKTKNTIWVILSAGFLFASCQSNSEKPVAQKTNETPAATVYTDNNDDAGLGGTTNQSTTTDDAVATAAACPPCPSVCATPARPAKRSVAYNWYRNRKKVRTPIAAPTPEVAVYTPEPILTPAPEPPVVQSEPIAYEKPNEFAGYVPPAPAPAPTPKRGKVHIAPEAGFNLNNLYKQEEDVKTSNMLKAGFHAGFVVNAEMGDNVSFQPGLRYIMKGGELTSTTHDAGYPIEHKDKLSFHYVEMPVNFVYKTGKPGGAGFLVGAGPYVSFLATAHQKIKDKEFRPDGIVVKEGTHRMQTGDPDHTGNIRKFDAGAGAFIGYQLNNGVYVKGGAEFGMLDLQKGTNTLGKFYNRNYNFLFTVGFMPGCNK